MSFSRRKNSKTELSPDLENWTEEEVQNLLKSILQFGLFDFKRILSTIPKKNKAKFQAFIRRLSQIAKLEKGTPTELIFNLKNWINAVELQKPLDGQSCINGPLELAVILKILSLDGVIENHPLPAEANGVDYGACYRVLYQAILGHPIQPVNKKTLDVLMDCFFGLTNIVDKNPNIVKDLQNQVHKKYSSDEPLTSLYTRSAIKNNENAEVTPLLVKSDIIKDKENGTVYKGIKTYSRKSKSSILNNDIEAELKDEKRDMLPKRVSVVVESLHTNPGSASCSLQMSVNLPTRMEAATLKKEEREALEDISYNPLNLPVEWLKNTSLQINLKTKNEPNKMIKDVMKKGAHIFSQVN